jgi:predicted DNA-binding protein
MIRTQIYIPEHLQKKLDSLSKSRGTSKAGIIREALELYCAGLDESDRKNKLKKGAGLWKDKSDIPNLRELRSELDRKF